MNVFGFELRKLFRDKRLWILFLVLMACNLFLLNGHYQTLYPFSKANHGSQAARDWYATMSQRYNGPLTREKLEDFRAYRWLMERNDRLVTVEELRSDGYASTGHLTQDKGLFETVFRVPMAYLIEYPVYRDRLLKSIERALNEEELGESTRKAYQDLGRRFSGRKISSLEHGDRYEVYFRYPFAAILSLLLLVVLVLKIEQQEQQTDMRRFIQTSISYSKVYRCKRLLIAPLAFVCLLIFQGGSYVYLALNSFPGNLEAPLYSLPSFYESGLSLSIKEYFAIDFLTRWLGILVILYIAAWLTKLVRAPLASAMVLLIFLSILYGLSEVGINNDWAFLKYFNPMQLVRADVIFTRIEYFKVASLAFPYHQLAIANCVLLVIVLYASLCIKSRRLAVCI
ncbi:MAG: hypothetical protein Q4P72_05745 [Eubacteriales bacterium]|nr:hypothetical protein [Eubacteriales bacterium]